MQDVFSKAASHIYYKGRKPTNKMTKNSKITKISLGILLLISTASVILRCIAITKYYNPENGYFGNKALINAANIITIAAVALFLISAFCGKKKENLRFNFSNPLTAVTSGLLSVAIAFLGVFLMMRAKAREDLTASINASPDLISIFEVILALLSFLSVIYLILCAIQKQRHSTKRAMLGLCISIFFAIYATYLYFETSLPINAPNKLVDQMAYLFTAIFFLFETRISLGRELWRPYVATGLIASTLCIYASIPSAIAYFSKGLLISNSIFDFALTFFVAIYALARVAQYAILKSDEEADFIFALRTRADEIEEKISTVEENQRLEYIALINKIGEENAILRAEEEARMAAEAKLAEELRIAEEAAISTEAENADDYIQESLFDTEISDEMSNEDAQSTEPDTGAIEISANAVSESLSENPEDEECAVPIPENEENCTQAQVGSEKDVISIKSEENQD